MNEEREKIRLRIIQILKYSGYQYRVNHFIPGQGDNRSSIIPFCILGADGNPVLIIRLRLRNKPKKVAEKPNKRLEKWGAISGCQVITIHSRSDAEKLPARISQIFSP